MVNKRETIEVNDFVLTLSEQHSVPRHLVNRVGVVVGLSSFGANWRRVKLDGDKKTPWRDFHVKELEAFASRELAQTKAKQRSKEEGEMVDEAENIDVPDGDGFEA